MNEVLLAFGRGLVRVLISLLIGTGAGLLTLGIASRDQPDLWKRTSTPAELFLALGVGMLTAGALMGLLFVCCRSRKVPGALRDERKARGEERPPSAE